MTTDGNEYHFPPVDRILTDIEVFRIAGELREDRGSPELARTLMAQFVAAAYTVDGPSRELVIWMRDALADHLNGASLDAAFRIKRGKIGRPPADGDRSRRVAEEILIDRVMHGKTFEEAITMAAERNHLSARSAARASKEYQAAALNTFLRRDPPAFDLADAEHLKRLERIFGKRSFAVTVRN